jgi:hypothetical protein
MRPLTIAVGVPGLDDALLFVSLASVVPAAEPNLK